MFKRVLFAGAALCTTVAVAQAAPITTFSSSISSPIPPTGAIVTPIAIAGVTGTPSTATITTPAYTVTITNPTTPAGEGIVNGTTANVHAVPVAGVMGTTPEYLTGDFGSALTTNAAASGNYFSTGNGTSTVTINFTTPQSSLALLWGSIDAANLITLSGGSLTGTDTLSGTQVATADGFVANGSQGYGGSAYVSLTDTAFTTVAFTSPTQISFEFSGVAGSNVPFNVPEPISLAMFGAGLAGLAGARRVFKG